MVDGLLAYGLRAYNHGGYNLAQSKEHEAVDHPVFLGRKQTVDRK